MSKVAWGVRCLFCVCEVGLGLCGGSVFWLFLRGMDGGEALMSFVCVGAMWERVCKGDSNTPGNGDS